MPRYVSQRDKSSCGPVAILNALKWAGADVTEERDLEMLRELTNCTPFGGKSILLSAGTNIDDFDEVISKIKEFSAWRVDMPSIKDVEDHVRSGGAVVIIVSYKERKELQSHYTLVTNVSATGGSLTLVNMHEGETVSIVRRQTMRSLMKTKQEGGILYQCIAWFISKNI